CGVMQRRQIGAVTPFATIAPTSIAVLLPRLWSGPKRRRERAAPLRRLKTTTRGAARRPRRYQTPRSPPTRNADSRGPGRDGPLRTGVVGRPVTWRLSRHVKRLAGHVDRDRGTLRSGAN